MISTLVVALLLCIAEEYAMGSRILVLLLLLRKMCAHYFQTWCRALPCFAVVLSGKIAVFGHEQRYDKSKDLVWILVYVGDAVSTI